MANADGKIRLTTRVEYLRTYEIDVALLEADAHFEDADLTSVEALADRFEDWLIDAQENWEAPWARELLRLNVVEREVYEVDLSPPTEQGTG